MAVDVAADRVADAVEGSADKAQDAIADVHGAVQQGINQHTEVIAGHIDAVGEAAGMVLPQAAAIVANYLDEPQPGSGAPNSAANPARPRQVKLSCFPCALILGNGRRGRNAAAS